MAIRTFIDTNILVYADASDEPAKQRAALAGLKQLYESGTGVLSTQVLQEYCNVAIRKLKLPAQHIAAQLDLYEQFEVLQVTPSIIRSALDLRQTHNIGFYDAVIVASAQVAGCGILLSDDMNAGENVGGVQVVNPFE